VDHTDFFQVAIKTHSFKIERELDMRFKEKTKMSEKATKISLFRFAFRPPQDGRKPFTRLRKKVGGEKS